MKIIDINCKGVSIPKPGSTTGETLDFIIPPGYQWVAVDSDGEVWAYNGRPYHQLEDNCWWDGYIDCEKIGSVGGKCQNWREMLIEVK